MTEKLAAKILRSVGWRSYAVAERISPTPPKEPSERELLMARWLANDGDKKLRQEYDLHGNDIVLDVGGYEGQWSSDIFARYGCAIHVFEPVPAYADNIRRRFERNPHVQLHAAGLGEVDGEMEIRIDENASSQFVPGGRRIQAPIFGFSSFMKKHGISEIALMKINIEGGEYPLLEGLIATGEIAHIRELQIQFHDFVPDAVQRMAEIQQQLAKTHSCTYKYCFIWENWRRDTSK